jgi:4'-phosphopantetheinyl transferase
LTKTEETLLLDRDDVILRRLCILLTIKTAYIKALGQPPGFDFSRIDCNIPEETIEVDGRSLTGWEFRLFKANLGVVRRGLLIEETYQCSVAVHRGGDETRFIWEEDEKNMANWVHFITTDTVLRSLTASPPRTDPKSVTP